MEPFTKEDGTVKGLEVLFIEDVEIMKIKGTVGYFAAGGNLSVLYFREYNRFVLKVNDWVYPLMKRIPVFAESGTISRIYLLPTLNGFTYRLIITNPTTPAFENLEVILNNSTNFTLGDTPGPRERSPDDKMRRPVTHSKDITTGITSAKPTSTITGLLKSGFEKVKHGVMGLGGTKNLTTTKRRVMMSDIKTKDFRSEAKPTFKSTFFGDEYNLTQKFLGLRETNPNNLESKEFKELKKFSDSTLPSLYLNKEDLEEHIYRQKDLVEQRMYDSIPEIEKKGIVSRIKDSVSGIIHREAPKENITQPEYVEHYQG